MNKKFPETDTERAQLVSAAMVFILTILLIQKLRIIPDEDFLGSNLRGWLNRFGYVGLRDYIASPCLLAAAGLLAVFGTSTRRRSRAFRRFTYAVAIIYLVLNLYTFGWMCVESHKELLQSFYASTLLAGPLMGIFCSAGAVLLLRAKPQIVGSVGPEDLD